MGARPHDVLVLESSVKKRCLLRLSRRSKHFEKVAYYSFSCEVAPLDVILPGGHGVHLKQWLRLLSCSVYVPSSHSTHTPLVPAVLQCDIRRFPENTQTQNIFRQEKKRFSALLMFYDGSQFRTSRAVQAADVCVLILLMIPADVLLQKRRLRYNNAAQQWQNL